MPRYFRKPAHTSPRLCDDDGEEWYEEPLISNVEVDDSEAIFTGLLDSDGSPIYRAPNPIGFGRDDEW